MTDAADRMFQLLVTTMTSRSPELLTRPFTVGELYQDILPYRLFRRELGLDSNQEYELTLTELLAGRGGYVTVDERMSDTLRRELESATPDSGAFKQFAATQVSIDPDALARVAQGQVARPSSARPPAAGTPAPASADGGDAGAGAMSAVPPATAMPPLTATGRPSIVAAAGESCRFCGGALPPGRPLTFCPHCGQDQTVLHCQACGTELEVGWKFCTTCGRGVGGNGEHT